MKVTKLYIIHGSRETVEKMANILEGANFLAPTSNYFDYSAYDDYVIVRFNWDEVMANEKFICLLDTININEKNIAFDYDVEADTTDQYNAFIAGIEAVISATPCPIELVGVDNEFGYHYYLSESLSIYIEEFKKRVDRGY